MFPKLIKSTTNNLVELDGIIYKLIPNFVKPKINNFQKNTLKNILKNYEASGLVYFENNKIQPVVYVKDTNTYVWETCCGSASIAYSVISKKKMIEQPSGEKVFVKIQNKDVIYSARCAMLR